MKFVVIILALLYLVSHTEWFNLFSTLTHGDWHSFEQQTLATLRIDHFGTWLSDKGFGRFIYDIAQGISWAIPGYLAKYLGMSFAMSERLVWFFPMMVFAIYGSYLFFNLLLKNKYAVLGASLVFNFNVYFLVLQTGHVTLAAAYSMIPLFFYVAFRAFYAPSLYRALLVALVLYAMNLYEPRMAYIVLGLWIGTCLFYWKSYKYHLVTFSVFVLLSIVYILPVIYSGSLEGNPITGRGLFGSSFFDLPSAIALFHTFWNGSRIVAFDVHPVPLYFWILPLFVLLGVLYNHKVKEVIIFSFIALLGIFLTKQSADPLPWFYQWAYDHIPVFNLYREASKFYSITAISYAVLIGYFIKYLFETKKEKIGYISVLLILCYSLANLIPFINKDIGTLFVPRSIESDYVKFNNYLVTDKTFSRMISVPALTKSIDYSERHPGLGAGAMVNNEWSNLYPPEAREKWLHTEDALTIPYKEKPENILSRSAIGYIVIPTHDRANNNDIYVNFGDDRESIVKAFEGRPYLHKLELGFNELVVYKVDSSLLRPRIYGNKLQSTIFQRMSPTLFTVNTTISEISSLKFLETFHSEWRLYLEPYSELGCSGVSSFTGALESTGALEENSVTATQECAPKSISYVVGGLRKLSQQPLFDDSHTLIYDYANQWILDPNYIKTNYSKEYYRENADGSIDVRLSLYFKPQSYFYVGGVISGATFLIVASYMLYVRIRERKKLPHKKK